MAEPQIKSRLESPELTTNQTAAVRQRLSACLASDPQHITRTQRGGHVKAIQDALEKIRQRRPDLRLPRINDDPGTYGESTAAAVRQYKENHTPRIVRTGQPLDDIVGRMTISAIDDDLLRLSPKPIPPEPPLPVVAGAGVQIGPSETPRGDRSFIVVNYYTNCGLETIGPGQVATSDIQRYTTLEGLIDVLLTRSEFQQVIVNHGDPIRGLLVRVCNETQFRETARVMFDLSRLADLMQNGPVNPNDPDAKEYFDDATRLLGVSRTVVTRIVQKLVELRKKQFVFHFRACHMRYPKVVASYKAAFGAQMITFHGCRLFYQVIRPVPFARGHSAADFPSSNNTVRDRARVFDDPLGLLSRLVIAIRDRDGHTFVDNFSFLEQPVTPGEIGEWARFLLHRWHGPDSEFVVPVMWEEVAPATPPGSPSLTFHCPLELGWRQKLMFV